MVKARPNLRGLGATLAIIALATGTLLLVWGDLRQFRAENRQSRHHAQMREMATDVHHNLVEHPAEAAHALAQSNVLRDVLSARADPDGPGLRAALATARRLLGATTVFYIDREGVVAAADQPDDPFSLTGRDLSAYSYVDTTLAGRSVVHVGVGDHSDRPGVFYTAPAHIAADQPPVGAIVVKIEVPQVAAALGRTPIPAVLESSNGVLLGASRSEWLSTAPTSQHAAPASQPAPGPLPTSVTPPFDPRGRTASWNGVPHDLVREPVGSSGWTLVGLLDAASPAPLTAAQKRHLITRAAVLVLAGLMIIALTALILKRVRLEADLRASHARVQAANRAKDGFLALLSHELRTPLTPVLARVTLLEREATLTPVMREAITMIRRNVETEARLIDDLLDLTRADSGKLTLDQEVVDIHVLMVTVATMFEDEAREKQLTLYTELDALRHHVKGDAHRLQQVLWNLVSNAIKFTPSGGQVCLSSGNEGSEGAVLRIDVRDTGKGIDAKLCARLFDPFEQGGGEVTRTFGGLGLGLAISRTLINAHHGTLAASSEGPGQGATFSIRLAALDLSVIPTAQPHPALGAAPTGVKCAPMRILLVEDHVDTRRVLERLLADMGHSVTAAGSMLDALKAANNVGFDLILSDLGLPDGTGTDLLRQLRRNGQAAARAVSISGFGSEADIADSRAAGFAAHLTKPVRVEQIEQVLVAASCPV